MVYQKVQFIAYSIHTAPRYNLATGKQEYAGLDGAADIQERLKLVGRVLETARTNVNTKQADATVLKLFMMPEFFFRGKNGAYNMDEVQAVVSGLQDLVKDTAKWQHWLFVFGTIIGSSVNRSAAKVNRLFGEIALPDTETYNYTLVQKGGFGDVAAAPAVARVVVKEHLSTQGATDFIPKQTAQGDMVLERVSYLPPAKKTGSEVQQKNYDGSAVFTVDGIRFGLEICLDHLAQRLKKSRNLPTIDIQLVPSGGMSIHNESVVARAGGYIFNCDGAGGDDGRIGSHSAVKKVGTGVAGKTFATIRKLGDVPIDLTSIQFDSIYPFYTKPDGSAYFPRGGTLHLYPELSLTDTNLVSRAAGYEFAAEQSLFPHAEAGLNYALSDEPVLINGMKVLFDQPVPVHAVRLKHKGEVQRGN